jgi:hypothetical protein
MARGPFKVVCYDDDLTDILTRFVRDVNIAQQSFVLQCIKPVDLPWNPTGATVDVGRLAQAIRRAAPPRADPDGVIAIVKQRLPNNQMSSVERPVAIVTTEMPNEELEPHAHAIVRSHIVRCAALLAIAQNAMEPPHARGCIFDRRRQTEDVISYLQMGTQCFNCSLRLRGHGLTQVEISDFGQMVACATGHLAVRLPPQLVYAGCPLGHRQCTMLPEISRGYCVRNVFLATAFGREWEDLIALLRVKVEEAMGMKLMVSRNVVNIGMLCEVCRDIRMCRYGIAEVSSLRLNVAYETGLMHAYGLDCVVALDRNKFAEFETRFSDLKGLKVILYDSTPELLEKLGSSSG